VGFWPLWFRGAHGSSVEPSAGPLPKSKSHWLGARLCLSAPLTLGPKQHSADSFCPLRAHGSSQRYFLARRLSSQAISLNAALIRSAALGTSMALSQASHVLILPSSPPIRWGLVVGIVQLAKVTFEAKLR
jgi:hypothetical protein